MKITKRKNSMDSYDFELKKDNKVLNISFGGTLDLYMSLSDGRKLDDSKDTEISIDITKEDYEVFSCLNTLYMDTISGNILGEYDKDSSTIDRNFLEQYNLLVDNNKNIRWISDDDEPETEDSMQLSHIDNDTYRLTFKRNAKSKEVGFKSHLSINVRFRNSGSRYAPFNCIFMRFYNTLQEIDPDYHQIHIEEYQYIKKHNQ